VNLNLVFLGGSVATGDRFELVFRATSGDDVRLVTVAVSVGNRRRVEFPNLAGEGGESLGSDDLDASVRERAEQVAALLDAAVAWSGFTRRRRA